MKFKLGYSLNNDPFFIKYSMAFSGVSEERIVTKSHDICIEGFPRSGNTFFTLWVKENNPTLKIGHHTHGAGNVIKAVKNKIPCIVLIRNPIDAIRSLKVQDSKLWFSNCIGQYIKFYSIILKLKNSVVISDFKDTINNPENSITALNKLNNIELKFSLINESDQSRIVNKLNNIDFDNNFSKNQSMLPNKEKEIQKKLLLNKLKKERKLSQALVLYNKLTEKNK